MNYLWLKHWLARHQHPASRAIHVIAVPLIPVALYLAVTQWMNGAWSLWWRPVGMLAASYVLQWVGHRLEGNDMGELILIKKLLRRPYVAVSPRYANPLPDHPQPV